MSDEYGIIRAQERHLFKDIWEPELKMRFENENKAPMRFVRDGIVNEDTWLSNQSAHIILLLKDTNGYVYWSTKEWLEKESFHHDHWKTWRLLAKCIHSLDFYKKNGVLRTYDEVVKAVNSAQAQHHQIKKSVVVNLKKQPGTSHISDEELRHFFNLYNREHFIDQLRLYSDIDFILCGGQVIFDIITDNHCEILNKIYGDIKIDVYPSHKCAVLGNGTVILGMDHPAIRYSHKDYYNQMIEELKFIKTVS